MGTGGNQAVTHTPKYIGLGCVVFVGLAMVLSLYYLLMKRKSETHSSSRMLEPSGGSLHLTSNNIDDERRFRGCGLASGITGLAANMQQEGQSNFGSLSRSLDHHRNPTGTAYTITKNSQSATNLDEAILPLTEDKTRF